MGWLLWVVVGFCVLTIVGGIIGLVKNDDIQSALTMFDDMDCVDAGYYHIDPEQSYVITSSAIESEERKKELERQLKNSRYGKNTINRDHTIEPAPIIPVSRVKCEYCGSKISSDFVNCPNCGAPV